MWCGKYSDFEEVAANKVPVRSANMAFFEPKMGQNLKSSTILFSRTPSGARSPVSKGIMLTYLSREINNVVGLKNDKVTLEGYIP